MKYHTLFFLKLGKMLQYLSSAAVVIGALRVNCFFEQHNLCLLFTTLLSAENLGNQYGARSGLDQNCLTRKNFP